MKKLLLLFTVIALNLNAQITFNEAIGGPDTDQAISAEATSDGGYIVVGWTLSYGAGGWDIYLVKVSATGALEWTRTYGGPGEEVDCYVHQTFDGGYIISARSSSFGAGLADVYLIKTTSTGEAQWTKTIGGNLWDEGHSVIQTPDSGYVHIGYTTSYGAGSHDCYLIKSNKSGDTEWAKSFGGEGNDNGHLIIPALNDGFIIIGETSSFGAGANDYYVVKTDLNGNMEWSKTYGGPEDDYGWDIKPTKDSCYILAGYTESFGAGGSDAYLIKIDVNGNVIWSRTYGNTAEEQVLSVRQTEDGGFIATGKSEVAGLQNADVYLLKTDVNGVPEWARAFGGSGYDASQSVEQTADNGYFISGQTSSLGQGSWDFYLIKTDAEGRTETCNLADPVVLMSSPASATQTFDPATLVFSGEVTGEPDSEIGSGGALMTCLTTSFEEIGDAENLNVYPNPATGILNINSAFNLSGIEIFDQVGRTIIKKQLNKSAIESLDVSGLNSGFYFIKCTSEKGVFIRKFEKVD